MSWVQISKIDDLIYLGGIPEPQDDTSITIKDTNYTPHKLLKDHNISTLVSFTGVPVKWETNYLKSRYHVVIPDSSYVDISKYFYNAIQHIRASVNNNKKVFIHCHMGISRSVTVLAAYYLKFGIPNNKNPTVSQVLLYIKEKRPFINPNPGFIKQLYKYHSIINPKT